MKLHKKFITVYGEMIIKLGDKEYLINAPKGVTIKEIQKDV